ncbi:MAG: hypothetical protein QM627_11085 [Luteolibacter sp.]
MECSDSTTSQNPEEWEELDTKPWLGKRVEKEESPVCGLPFSPFSHFDTLIPDEVVLEIPSPPLI